MKFFRYFPLATAIVLLASILLAVTLGHREAQWTWGPGLVILGLATSFAFLLKLKQQPTKSEVFILISGALLVLYLAARMFSSPVDELAMTDGLLLAAAVSTFFCFRAILGGRKAVIFFGYGLLTLLLTNAVAIFIQGQQEDFALIDVGSKTLRPAGLFGHYAIAAAFQTSGILLLAGAIFSPQRKLGYRVVTGLTLGLSIYAVYLTESRSGALGLGVGLISLVAFQLFSVAKTQRGRLVIISTLVPVILIGGAILSVDLLANVQEARSQDNSSEGLFDSPVRFMIFSLALSCIASHPWLGGGSRSFSWESYQFWDVKEFIWINSKPEQAHNEILQLITDYGLIGGALLLIFLSVIFICALTSVLLKVNYSVPKTHIPWVIGGFGAVIALLAQCNFEGIFQVLPIMMMLAVCLAAASYKPAINPDKKPRFPFSALATALFLIPAISLSVWGGIKGSLVGQEIREFSYEGVDDKTTPEKKIESYSAAISHWPLGSLYYKRAILRHNLSTTQPAGLAREELQALAIADYEIAMAANPFDPEMKFNFADLLSFSASADQSITARLFTLGIREQGETESLFSGNLRYASHLYRQAYFALDNIDPTEALRLFEESSKYFDAVADLRGNYFGTVNQRMNRVDSLVKVAFLLGQLGEDERALHVLDRAAILPHGDVAHFYAAKMIGLDAALITKENPQRAIELYQLARQRLNQVAQDPVGEIPGIVGQYKELFDQRITKLSSSLKADQ